MKQHKSSSTRILERPGGVMNSFAQRFMQGCLFAIGFVCHAALADVPTEWIDDAQLNDVQLVLSKHAFAAGEHGAIWKSEDGGRSWNRLDCGMDVSLKSICFLTDQVGWVVGGDTNPYSQQDGGVLFATQDGGHTWKRPGRAPLPVLNHVKFFDLDEGIVVGQPTPVSPSGIFKTTDGGKTWHGVQGETAHAWKAMSFLEPQRGVVAGVNGRVSLMGADQLYESRLPARGLRSIKAISLSHEGAGWLAGDGGLVLKSSNDGIAWESPPTPLPEELRETMDFRAIEARGEKLWLAGSPGSVIWHSPDGGRKWLKQLTGQTSPISALRFSNDQHGIAVGAFGLIIRTENGGKTWQAVQGDGRRAAFLALHARVGQACAPLIARLSGESGYRSAVWIAERNDLGPLSISTDGESRLQSAVQKCGGHASDIHWQLPITIPGVEYSSEKLTAEWQKQTEGRLPQTMIGGIVRQIRTWRPNIVFVDQPSPDDAASQILFAAIQTAVAQAADKDQYAEQAEFAGLNSWNVDRIYMKLAPGANGDAQIVLDEFLPYLKSSTRIISTSSVTLLRFHRVPVSDTADAPRIAYRLLEADQDRDDTSTEARSGKRSGTNGRDFFGGLSIEPGSDARRSFGTLDESSFERVEKLLHKQRNFTAYSQKSLDDPRISGQMLGQLRNVVEGMEPQQGAGLLCNLADEYRKRSQFEMVESTYLELIHLYPKEPMSLDAMRWLIQFWCSGEMTWQRLKNARSQVSLSQTNPVRTARYVQQGDSSTLLTEEGTNAELGERPRAEVTTAARAGSPTRFTATLDVEEDQPPGKKKGQSARLKLTQTSDSRSSAANEWQTRAISVAKQLEAAAPGMFRTPEIQFPLAVLRRTRGSENAATSIIRKIAVDAVDVDTKRLVERDLWASFPTIEEPQALAICRRVTQRPHLDGSLSEPCWQIANELRLTEAAALADGSRAANNSPGTTSMFAYDDEFLYVAFNLPRSAKTPRENPQHAGRKHDADLSRNDRISIYLDIDRDYATWYEFQIDQRGWTAESCWEDRRWNPQWYVAADGDQTDWRVEAAISWSDLTPIPPKSGTIYALSILRTIPAVGLESWTHPATTQMRPANFGLLKFE
jgi:photosystem II stability/assembly factor-like uncharacterized protein